MSGGGVTTFTVEEPFSEEETLFPAKSSPTPVALLVEMAFTEELAFIVTLNLTINLLLSPWVILNGPKVRFFPFIIGLHIIPSQIAELLIYINSSGKVSFIQTFKTGLGFVDGFVA
jgi:hypothetical protein